MIGRTLGHYRIVEKIGEGGMGEVYRARDERLDRDIAVKVLPPGTLANEAARQRFRKEALALAKLNHPNIATVHEFDTQDGVDFLVMEHIVGVSLAEKLAGGPLPEQEVARLGSQVAAALEEAHEHGVVHRDLKPGNIKVTPKGHAKVLDFGLARLLKPFSEGGTTESLTETHALAGTLPYMAPEQLRGQPADARSDIWALGVVLYEAVTGARPFQGGSGAELSAAILRERPRACPPRVPAPLQQVIERCLEKEPGRRYQRAGEVRAALEAVEAWTEAFWEAWRYRLGRRPWLTLAVAFLALLVAVLGLNVGQARDRLARLLGIGGPPRIESLAVLPLENLSGDPEQEYFADGMTEALITELSKISALKVISRTSAMQYKGAKKPMPQIARELDVDALIEGSVAREGEQVRITVQLIHGPTDKHLWAESYQREMQGILVLQSQVAREIAREIKVAVSPAEATRLASIRTVNPEAHELYLKGRYHHSRITEEDFNKAKEYFQLAIEKDPSYAPAHARLADNYAVAAIFGALPPREAFPKATEAVLRALELDSELADAHTVLGNIKRDFDWDWAGAEREYRRSLELNPGNYFIHYMLGLRFLALGQSDKAAAELERARRLDPLNLALTNDLAWVHFQPGQYDRAIEQFRKTSALDPNFLMAHREITMAYEQNGMFAEAIAEGEKAVSLSRDPYTLSYLGRAYAVGGKRAEAMKILNELKQLSKQRYVSSFHIADVYVGLGEKDMAFAWLEKAHEERSPLLIWLKIYPPFNGLREDPRFQSLLRRMNFPD